jgi:hypothetical protein
MRVAPFVFLVGCGGGWYDRADVSLVLTLIEGDADHFASGSFEATHLPDDNTENMDRLCESPVGFERPFAGRWTRGDLPGYIQVDACFPEADAALAFPAYLGTLSFSYLQSGDSTGFSLFAGIFDDSLEVHEDTEGCEREETDRGGHVHCDALPIAYDGAAATYELDAVMD